MSWAPLIAAPAAPSAISSENGWYSWADSPSLAPTLWADYLVDLIFAYLAGIAFQYFAIAPMRKIHGWKAIKEAIKADTLSLLAFEVGMFAWMGFSHQVLFQPPLTPNDPVYWFMMQIAMVIGFATSLPANWFLIRSGIKEAM